MNYAVFYKSTGQIVEWYAFKKAAADAVKSLGSSYSYKKVA
jgi:hypothetical protein